MALQSFRVQNRKSIRLAEATHVPKVMIIAGPNGVGKSTLLFAIKERVGEFEGGSRTFYQGPHRVLRSTNVQRGWLGGTSQGMLNLLEGNDVSGFTGLNFHDPRRVPENVDEVGSTIKHTLGKIENRRQAILASTIDRLRESGNNLDIAGLPDIYEPAKRLTQYLLPHLQFHSIDFSNEENIKCLWKRNEVGGTRYIDIDELSSGEKAVIVLFLPLLEDQIQTNLRRLENYGTPAKLIVPPEERLVLIDEPELHLHPDLQSKILSYMRAITRESDTKFIITTHSPTILDQAFVDELYVLSEASENPNENQLKQIATNNERLEVLKQLAGSTYFLTTGRVIVCIEGEPDVDPEKPTDARLLEILYPRTTAVTLVPTRGKGNVINTVERLRDHLPENTFRIRVRGLVDADQSQKTVQGVEQLPVCMIENLLLDPESIYAYCCTIGVNTLTNPSEVRSELKSIATELRQKEISLRIQKRLKAETVRFDGATVEQIRESHAKALNKVNALLPSEEQLGQMVKEITEVVDQILAADQELNYFRGKNILELFYQRHIAPKNIGYNRACIEIAKNVAQRGHIAPVLDPVFDRLLSQ